MAALRCPEPGHDYRADGGLCPKHHVPLMPDEPDATPPPAQPPPPPQSCSEPGCGNPAGSAGQCLLHAIGERVGQLALRFPWGVVAIPDAGLVVGRSGRESPLAAHITDDAYGNVSRRHAIVTRDGDRLYVRDFDSRNHTFVNGKRIDSYTPHELRAGDLVRFGADLAATVEHPVPAS